MNLKVLSLSVLILAILSGLVAWLNRPLAPADADPRVGTSLLADIPVNDARTISVTNNADSVTLTRDDDEAWQVDSYHGLPADTAKLRRLLQELGEAEIVRVVTRSPDRAARLDLGTATVSIDDTPLIFGQNASGGGRYLRLVDDESAPVYLTPASLFIDGTAKNWAASALTAMAADEIQSITVNFPDGPPLTANRESADATWTAELGANEQLRTQPLTSLLTTLQGLRFSDTTSPDDAEVMAARDHQRTFTVTTFGGETLTWNIGRKPEETIGLPAPEDPVAPAEGLANTADPEPESAEDALADLTETIPAGPVYVSFAGSESLAPLISFQNKLAFRVSDFVFTGLPANRDALVETTTPTDTEIDPPFPAAE